MLFQHSHCLEADLLGLRLKDGFHVLISGFGFSCLLKISVFSQMVGFDSVDDESRVSKFTMEGGDLPTPEKWTSDCNPPYSYWLYYMYSNIRALNLFLEARGLRTLSFRYLILYIACYSVFVW